MADSKRVIRIAVMGVTGSGKSTFIQKASQQKVAIGHDYTSLTSEVVSYDFEMDGHSISLIDTPGFNDTLRSEAQVLTEIANYLEITYRVQHLKLDGIVYMQSIMDERMYGSSLRNLKMFRDLCGDSPMKNVVLVTNRWEQARALGDFDKAREKEQQLRTSSLFWEPLMKRGAEMLRWEDAQQASAFAVIRKFLTKNAEVLQIQTEIVEQGKKLIDTTAGTTVNEEVLKKDKEYQLELSKIRQELNDAKAAHGQELEEVLSESKRDYERKLDRVRDEQEILRYERRSETRRMQNEMDDLRAAYNRKLDEQLSAQRIGYENVIAELRANSSKLRPEQHECVQEEIKAMERKPKKERSASTLLMNLIPMLGNLALGLVVPSPVLDIISSLWSFIGGNQ
ncbi:hypothetical protein M409DRAFT_25824 [Zasmidium cellare ATCC 36951]|uniref:G domain-containing protein n=1 Tax=Zasmidium cellare ATCC 36951 TaxID=1080233 RepID=A0A6A6CDY5_ZASCE|nr:uncharacterized protein M409DRAFT_25824 [Zasmidium cellare ATCC 36951]KAF2163636.1 hypothetical protein M409DRAFT_25824 [Zasmidium cellare ATCC 36951]